MRPRTWLRALVFIAPWPALAPACQVVAGIEERKLDPAAATSKLCSDYCDAVMDACTGKFAVYPNREQCLGVCSKLPEGDTEEQINENSVACRLRYALSAKREQEDCKFAGPGGNGECGSDCEGYCAVFAQACPDQFEYTEKTCLKACAGLTDQPDRYSLKEDHEGDTIECRLVHSASATIEPKTHCEHATIVPAQPYCIGDAKAEPTCEEYCDIELAACDRGLAQYETPEQCLAACAALPRGMNQDQSGNTVACRRYHSFSATTLPDTHCYHSGPTGDGHCGGETGNCEAYCALVAAACPQDFAGEEQCLAACADLPDSKRDSKFTLKSAAESTGYQCRVLHTLRAFDDARECTAALGGAPCE